MHIYVTSAEISPGLVGFYYSCNRGYNFNHPAEEMEHKRAEPAKLVCDIQ